LSSFLVRRCPCHVLRARNKAWRAYTTSTTDLADDVSKIRNFSIIAHVDHGKSTLADRLLEMTGAISKSSDNKQVLDRLQVEKERGITVKSVAATLQYKEFSLNLIDTPGHVDFSNEVSRAIAACQGVILLIDANEGVQAQTVANFYLAFTAELVIIPVLNKIDLKNANPDRVTAQLKTLFDIDSSNVLRISAKTGVGVEKLLDAIVDRIPPPKVTVQSAFRALLIDSWFDRYRGAILFVVLAGGKVKLGDNITCYSTKKTYQIKSLGQLVPEEIPVKELSAGQVGIITGNIRTASEAQIGDTLHHEKVEVEPLPRLPTAKPMVFAGLFPVDQSKFQDLKSAIEKLSLNDPAVSIANESSPALGYGWRLGFLGLLHLDVFRQRLEQEHSTEVVLTAPSVTYKLKILGAKNIKKAGGDIIYLSNPAQWPDPSIIAEISEPFVSATILLPQQYMGKVISLCLERRGVQELSTMIDNERAMMKYSMPLSEVVVDFHDTLKSLTSGYASFDYEDSGYQPSSLVKMDILLNGKLVDELAMIVHSSHVNSAGRRVVLKLKEMIPRQMVHIAIQAVIGGHVVARENLKAFRKDVAAKLYGGDITRRMKLVRAQTEGKKKMRMIANVQIPKDTFIDVLKNK